MHRTAGIRRGSEKHTLIFTKVVSCLHSSVTIFGRGNPHYFILNNQYKIIINHANDYLSRGFLIILKRHLIDGKPDFKIIKPFTLPMSDNNCWEV